MQLGGKFLGMDSVVSFLVCVDLVVSVMEVGGKFLGARLGGKFLGAGTWW